MKTKIPYGLKLYLIQKTGETYYNINRVLNGESTNVILMEKVTHWLAEYNRVQEELDRQIESAR